MGVECEFDHAGGMTDIPHHERAGVVNLFGDGFDVEQLTGAIVDMREHDHGDPLIE